MKNGALRSSVIMICSREVNKANDTHKPGASRRLCAPENKFGPLEGERGPAGGHTS